VVNLLLLASDDDPLRVETCCELFILIYTSVGVKDGVIVYYLLLCLSASIQKNQNTIFIKEINAPTDCTGSSNRSG
jgi:hypothetical protein